MPLRHLLAAALCALLPVAAQAQDPAPVEVRPGSPLLDASRMITRTDTFQVDVDGAGPLQMVIRTAALGDTALLRVERLSFGETELGADSFAVHRATLAPLYGEASGFMGTSRLRFRPGGVEGTYTPDGEEERPVSDALGAPVFYANSVDLVLGSLPLEAGRSFDLATWTPEGLDGVIAARVVGTEEVRTAQGARCTGWRVETQDEDGQASVYWIEQGTRSLLAFSAGWMEIRVLRHSACR